MPSKEQCYQAAADVYGQILADPERRAEIVAARERRAVERTTSKTKSRK